jgi:hypothetical protein
VSETLHMPRPPRRRWEAAAFVPSARGWRSRASTTARPPSRSCAMRPARACPRISIGGSRRSSCSRVPSRRARATIPQGALVLNPEGTSHIVWSEDGCVVLIQWTLPVEFLPSRPRGPMTRPTCRRCPSTSPRCTPPTPPAVPRRGDGRGLPPHRRRGGPGDLHHPAPERGRAGRGGGLPPFDPAAYPLWGVPFAVKDNIDVARPAHDRRLPCLRLCGQVATPSSLRACARRGRSRSARRTSTSSPRASSACARPTACRATPSIPPSCRAARPRARRSRWRAGSSPSRSAPTRPGRAACLRRSTTSWG